MTTAIRRVAISAVVALAFLGGVPTAHATFEFTMEVVNQEPIKIGPVGFEFVRAKCVVTNTGTDADTYDVTKMRDAPASWDVSICVGAGDGNCYAPFVEFVEDALALAPAATDTVSIYFTPISGEGSGYADLTVASSGDPLVEVTRTLGCVTDGCDIVIVDDDAGDTVETFLVDAVPPPFDPGVWRRDLEVMDSDAMGAFPVVAWMTGTNSNTLDDDDRAALEGYMGAGGRVWLTGQDIAFDLCDPSSPNHTAASQAWFETWMLATYVADDSGALSCTAVADDPIAQGTDLALAGGDGANNQTDPDVLSTALGSGAAWEYPSGDVAAVRIVGDLQPGDPSYRALCMGFGFEAIDNAATRQAMALNSMAWLSASLVGVDDPAGVAPGAAIVLDSPRPNPFNPGVTIPFAIDEAGPVTLRVLDASGRLVRTLEAGALAAGRHVGRWDGLDDSGVRQASGVYLFELRGAGQVLTRKAVLAK